ncbi:MAG: hypothetical protein ABSF71_08205 [Terriglobia bacterium]|jgi:hypothetical protein
MTRLRFSFLAFVLIWAGSFLACSKSTPYTSPNTAKSAAAPAAPAAPAASASSGLPQPCSLVTAKDGEEVYGAGAQIKQNGDISCEIDGPNLMTDGLIGVDIKLIDPKDWDGGKQSVFAMFPKEKSVSGIGDDAYTFSDGIVFHKGKVEVNVITSGYLGHKPKAEVAKHIAEQVAARL